MLLTGQRCGTAVLGKSLWGPPSKFGTPSTIPHVRVFTHILCRQPPSSDWDYLRTCYGLKTQVIPRQFLYRQHANQTLNRWPVVDIASESNETVPPAPSESERRLLILLSKLDSPKSEYECDAEVSWCDIVDATFDFANDRREIELSNSKAVDDRSRWKKEDWLCMQCLRGFLKQSLEELVERIDVGLLEGSPSLGRGVAK